MWDNGTDWTLDKYADLCFNSRITLPSSCLLNTSVWPIYKGISDLHSRTKFLA